MGVNKFIFEADAPKTNRIPDADILGVTVVILSCAYDGRENLLALAAGVTLVRHQPTSR